MKPEIPTDSCVVRYSTWRNGVPAALCTTFTVGGILMILSSQPWGLWIMLFFGSGALLLGGHTISRRPLLVINDHGITTNTKQVGLIPWSDISEVRFSGVSIFILLRNPDTWWKKIPTVARLFWTWFPKWRGISVPLWNVNTPSSKIRKALEQYGGSREVKIS